MTTRRRAALAVAAGAVLALGAPPIEAWPAVFVALALLAASWDGARPREAFLCGWLMGTVATLGAFYWIVGTVTRFTELPLIAAITAYVLMSCAAGLTLGCAGLLAAASAKSVSHPIAGALAIIVVERYAPSVFPWQVASPLIVAPWIPQCADVLGVSGLGAALFAVMAVLARVVRDGRMRARAVESHRAQSAWAIAGAVLMFAALWTYGGLRDASVRRATAAAPIVRVALVQPVIPPTVRWDEQNFGAILAGLRAQTAAALREQVDLVVWPEGAYPYPLPAHAMRDGSVAEPVYPGRVNAPILVGAIVFDEHEHRYNGALVRSIDGVLGAPVAKRVLVPFGEYIPIVSRIDWVRRTFRRVQGITPGDRPEVLRVGEGLTVGVLNCFEDTLGYVAADAVGVDLLVNITNDAWFGQGAAPWQHLMLARWRAIELRREMLRAVNTGVTGRVDARGRLIERAPLWERAVVISDARQLRLRTIAPYTIRFAPPFAALVLVLAIAVELRRARASVRGAR